MYLEKEFHVPFWIEKGAFTKKMFEPVFYTEKFNRKTETIKNAQSLVNIVDMIYDEAITKAENVLKESAYKSLNERAAQKILERLENEYNFVSYVMKQYKDIAVAGFDYESRFRQDKNAAASLNGIVYPAFDPKIRIFYKGQRKRTDKSYDPHEKAEDGRDFTTLPSLLKCIQGIELNVNKNLPIEETSFYKEFCIMANQITVAHAVIFYANEIEERHNNTLNYLSNNMKLNNEERNDLIGKETHLYENQISKIQYEWDTIKYELIQNIDKKQVLKLQNIKEEPVETYFDKDINLNQIYKNNEFYEKAYNNIVNIKKTVLQKETEKEI